MICGILPIPSKGIFLAFVDSEWKDDEKTISCSDPLFKLCLEGSKELQHTDHGETRAFYNEFSHRRQRRLARTKTKEKEVLDGLQHIFQGREGERSEGWEACLPAFRQRSCSVREGRFPTQERVSGSCSGDCQAMEGTFMIRSWERRPRELKLTLASFLYQNLEAQMQSKYEARALEWNTSEEASYKGAHLVSNEKTTEGAKGFDKKISGSRPVSQPSTLPFRGNKTLPAFLDGQRILSQPPSHKAEAGTDSLLLLRAIVHDMLGKKDQNNATQVPSASNMRSSTTIYPTADIGSCVNSPVLLDYIEKLLSAKQQGVCASAHAHRLVPPGEEISVSGPRDDILSLTSPNQVLQSGIPRDIEAILEQHGQSGSKTAFPKGIGGLSFEGNSLIHGVNARPSSHLANDRERVAASSASQDFDSNIISSGSHQPSGNIDEALLSTLTSLLCQNDQYHGLQYPVDEKEANLASAKKNTAASPPSNESFQQQLITLLFDMLSTTQ